MSLKLLDAEYLVFKSYSTGCLSTSTLSLKATRCLSTLSFKLLDAEYLVFKAIGCLSTLSLKLLDAEYLVFKSMPEYLVFKSY